MSQQTPDNPPSDDQPSPDAESLATPGEQPDQDPLEILAQERDKVEDKLARLSADYHNFIRRSRTHLEAELQEQLLGVGKALVIVLDQLDHALVADPEKASIEDLLVGVKIVRDELLKALEGFDIKRLDAKRGQEFDPIRHEALMRQEDDEIESNHIVAQLQPGYVLGDKTIRPAQVTLAQ
jgi:molecular chaperone GrpE